MTRSPSRACTAIRPPRMNGRPAGWGGASTWPMSSTRDIRSAVYGSFTLLGQDWPHEGVSAMQLGASFKLGPFTVDSAGGLSPCDPAMAPAFLFRWHDRIVRARLDKADNETGRLILQVTLARVRSSASTPDEMLRPRSFALLRWLERSTPPSLARGTPGRPSRVAGNRYADRAADHRRRSDHRDHPLRAGSGAVPRIDG